MTDTKKTTAFFPSVQSGIFAGSAAPRPFTLDCRDAPALSSNNWAPALISRAGGFNFRQISLESRGGSGTVLNGASPAFMSPAGGFTGQRFTLGGKGRCDFTVLTGAPLAFMSFGCMAQPFTLGSGRAACTVLKQSAFCGLPAFMNTSGYRKELNEK